MGGGLALTACAGGGPAGKRYPVTPNRVLDIVERGEGPAALAFYQREAAEQERRGRNADAAKAHAAATITATRLGAYQPALRAGLRALDLLTRQGASDEILDYRTHVYFHLGATYVFLGDLEQAQRYLREGLELSRTRDVGRALAWGGAFERQLGSVALARGDPAAALPRMRESVRLLESLLARYPNLDRWSLARWSMGWSYYWLGRAERQVGNLEEAERALRQAIRIAEGFRSPEARAHFLPWLGEVALDRGTPRPALGHFQQALDLAERLRLTGVQVWGHAGIGRSHLAEGRPEEALAAFRRAADLIETVRGGLQEVGLRSGYLEDKQEIYHSAVRSALALDRPAEAFTFAERGRARAFLDLLGNQTTLSKGRTRALVEEEVRLRAQLSEAQALVQDALGLGTPARAREQFEAVERAYRAFLDRVRSESLEQASLMTVEPVALEAVQRLLPPGTTLLEYLVTERETVLWIIDRERVTVQRLPVPRAALLDQVQAFRQAIAQAGPLEQVHHHAARLYERLLQPARPHLPGDRLVLVPHDLLHYLPFGALRSPEGRWLVEDYTLTTLPSASVLKYLQGKGADAGAHTLAVGNPDLGPALALRYAEREARAVGDRFPGATVLLRQAATEARVKALGGAASLLHFATHGELNEKDPLSSALLLVPDGPEDGRLEVREILALDLNARLVVLSACETGLGRLSRGDELVGLQRAFLYAGSAAVLTTLWKVDDRATFLLMREFYDHLPARGPPEALRQAQRAVLAEFPHPFAWAAFGLTGAPR